MDKNQHIQNSVNLAMGDSKMNNEVIFQIDNLSELQKLTQQAEIQLSQLKQTLELIDGFKIQVSLQPTPEQH